LSPQYVKYQYKTGVVTLEKDYSLLKEISYWLQPLHMYTHRACRPTIWVKKVSQKVPLHPPAYIWITGKAKKWFCDSNV